MASVNGTRTPPKPVEVDKASTPAVAELGGTGLQHSGGQILEEWIRPLEGQKGIKAYEEMGADPVVGSMLSAVTNELRRVEIDIEPAEDTPEAEAVAEFVEGALDDMSHTWEDFITEALTMLQFGWAYFEIVYKVRRGEVADKPGETSGYSDGKLGWRKFAIRGQNTLARWGIDEAGGIEGMYQWLPTGSTETFIPIQKSALFRPLAHKGNPQGQSALRSAWIPYFRRRRLQEVEAIGIDRDMVGVPKIGVPAEWLLASATAEQKAAVAEYRRIGEQARMDEQACLVWPNAYDANGNQMFTFELVGSPGARSTDVTGAIGRYNQEIMMTMLADVILMGHERVGTQALSKEKYQAFNRGLEAYLRGIAAVMNRHVIPRLLRLNNMDTSLSPELHFGDVATADLDVLGKWLSSLAAAGYPLFPDQELESWIARQAGMPYTPLDQRPMEPEPPAPAPPPPPAEPADEELDVGPTPAADMPT